MNSHSNMFYEMYFRDINELCEISKDDYDL